MTNKKMQLEQYLKEITKKLDISDMSMFCTTSIGKEKYLSRTLTSQYLNELNKEKKIVKINSRPVYYLSIEGLEVLIGNRFEQTDFLNIAEFIDFLARKKEILRDFTKAIGNDGSLEYCIDQMKSAVIYPHNGLHTLLYGSKGSGKRYLVGLLYEFGCNQKIFSKASRLMEVEIKKNNESAMRKLFGETGYLQTFPEGLLYIYNVENMNEEFQEKLQDVLALLSKRKLQRAFRVIIGVNDSQPDGLQDTLQYGLPVKCRVPSYNERSLEEKEDFILRFFKEEQDKLQRRITISASAFRILLNASYGNGIMDLKSLIRNACANAYAQREVSEDTCTVCLLHLPVELLEYTDLYIEPGMDKERYYTLSELRRHDDRERILSIFDDIVDQFVLYQQSDAAFHDLLRQSHVTVQKYYDYLIFGSHVSNVRFEMFGKLLEDILVPILKDSQVSIPQNCIFVLAQILLVETKQNSGIYLWTKDRWQEIQDCLNILKKELPLEYAMTQSISTRLYEKMEYCFSQLNQIFMILNINFYNRELNEQTLHGIIIAHGCCTASSIVDAVNSLLQKNVFEAINMPLSMPFSEIEHELNHHIELHPRWKSLVLMVDMGSLEEIGKHVHANIKVGVLNNISTGTALEVGELMIQNLPIEEILPTVCEKSACRYQLIQPQKKEKAMLFTNDAGIEVSRRLADLFRNSLPKHVDVRFIEYDFERLMANRDTDIVFTQFDIVLIVKPYHLDINYYPSVALEDIINFKAIHKVNEALSSDLQAAEIQQFNEALLKNFSLQNIMENLTILNPRKLLDFVSISVQELQRRLSNALQSKTIVGIYIHVSLLIERLVTNHPIDFVGDLSEFDHMNKQFIEDVKESFELMLKNYSVQLPLSEIYYLYNYISSDKESGKEEC